MPLTTYRHQKRGGRGVTAMATGDTDFVQHLFVASSKDTLLIFTDEGKAYPLKTYEVPQGSRTSKGRAIVNVLRLDNNVQTTAVLAVKEFEPNSFIIMATQQGMVKRCSLKLFANARKSGIIAITLKKEDRLIGVQLSTEQEDIVLATKKGHSIRFGVKQARATGRQSQGVRGIKLAKTDIVLGMEVVEPSLKKEDLFLLTATEKGFAKRTQIKEYRSQSRGGKGIINIKLASKVGEVKGILLVESQDEVMYITEKGILIRTKVKDIRTSGRSTQGVKVINLGKGDKLAAIAHVVSDG
jgi:DNA gyrase subunit A